MPDPTSRTYATPQEEPEVVTQDRSGALAIGVMVVAIALLVVLVFAIVQAM